MSGMKGGALLLLLGIPFALYAAWQVYGAAHTGSTAPEPPADKGASKEQLAASNAKASKWADEARKTVEVSWQYRTAGSADNSSDATVSAVVKAASARATDLNDLDRFLSNVEKPEFTGKLKPRYDEWTKEQAALRVDAQAVVDWLANPPPIASSAEAEKATAAILKLINQYAARSRFADKNKAMVWRLRARFAIIDALVVLADGQYRTATRVKLPLERGANAGTVAAITLAELKAQMGSLNADLKQADEDKVPLDTSIRAAVDARVGGADEYTAREELLALFAKADLFDNANGAAPWLKLVAAQYAKTKDEKVRALIREKVQEFADAFIPIAARLDDDVLLQGKRISRKTVTVSYEEKLAGNRVSKPLVADANGFNEFEIARKPPGFNQLVTDGVTEYELKDLAPTDLSKAAVAFNAARAKLADRTTAPRWTAKSVEDLKNKCEAQKELVDQLRLPDSGIAGTGPKIATRVTGLVAGMEACKELFEVEP